MIDVNSIGDQQPVKYMTVCCSEEVSEDLVIWDFDGGTTRCPNCHDVCHVRSTYRTGETE